MKNVAVFLGLQVFNSDNYACLQEVEMFWIETTFKNNQFTKL